jgi:hypothetical protein
MTPKIFGKILFWDRDQCGGRGFLTNEHFPLPDAFGEVDEFEGDRGGQRCRSCAARKKCLRPKSGGWLAESLSAEGC